MTHDSGTVSIDVLQFSVLAIVQAGSCPCYNTADLDLWATTANERVTYYGGVSTSPVVVDNDMTPPVVGVKRDGSAPYRKYCYSPDSVNWSWDRTRVSHEEYVPCKAILEARFHHPSRTNLSVGAVGLGLSGSESVSVDVTATPPSGSPTTESLTVTGTQPVDWMTGLYTEGTDLSATVTTSPGHLTCALSPHNVTTLGTQNAGMLVQCGTPCDLTYTSPPGGSGTTTMSGACGLIGTPGGSDTPGVVFVNTSYFDSGSYPTGVEDPAFWSHHGNAVVVVNFESDQALDNSSSGAGTDLNETYFAADGEGFWKGAGS